MGYIVEKNKYGNKYDDIINFEHPTSKKHPRMSLYDRAAQFSPFAALTGYETAVRETARLTAEKHILSDDDIAVLNRKLHIISEKMEEMICVSITYFVPDKNKDGGAYITCSGVIKRIDSNEGKIIMNDNISIPIEDIVQIESELFSNFFDM